MAQTSNAATISKLMGGVIVERVGTDIEFLQGDAIFATDTLKTQKAAVELTFSDGSIVILGPNSVLKVEASNSADQDSTYILNLSQGALRTISGMSDAGHEVFKVVTCKGTLNVKGVDAGVKIDTDGSESIVAFSVKDGHSLVITAADNSKISINTAEHACYISADGTLLPTPVALNADEMFALVNHMVKGIAFYEKEAKLFAGLSQEENEPQNIAEQHIADDAEFYAALGQDEQEFIEDAEKDAANDDETEEENIEGENSTNILNLAQNVINDLSAETLVTLTVALEDAGFSTNVTADELNQFMGTGDNSVLLAPSSGGTNSSTIVQETSPIIVVDGDANFSGYSPAINSGTHTSNDQTIVVTTDIKDNNVISGDVQDNSGATLNAGSDSITAGNLTRGRIVGDVNTMSNGTLIAGNDSITVTSKTGGNSIYGDIYDISAGVVTFGHDYITVTEKLENSYVAGDAYELSAGVSVAGVGNDTIAVTELGTNGKIYGDYVNAADSVDGGGDRIGVAYMNDGLIHGGAGNDTVTVQRLKITTDSAMRGGEIHGDAGNDQISITNMYAGQIDGGAGNDTIVITNAYGGDITGGAGRNSYYLDNIHGDKTTVTATGDTDYIFLRNGIADGNKFIISTDYSVPIGIYGGVANGYSTPFTFSSGEIEITTASNILVDTIDGGTLKVTGASSQSIFTLYNVNSGEVVTSSANDHINIRESMTGGIIDGGAGNDVIGSPAATAEGVQNFLGVTMSGGTINGGAGNDYIRFSDDNDSTTVMTAGTINAGEGQDSVVVRINGTTKDNSTIDFGDDSESDSLYISGNGSITVKNFDFDDDDKLFVGVDPTQLYSYAKDTKFGEGTEAKSLEQIVNSEGSIKINDVIIYFEN